MKPWPLPKSAPVYAPELSSFWRLIDSGWSPSEQGALTAEWKELAAACGITP